MMILGNFNPEQVHPRWRRFKTLAPLFDPSNITGGPMRKVIIESPFRGDSIEERNENIAYARKCCEHAASQGEIPFASHLFFPQFLNEDKPADRELGITAGYSFWDWADMIVFYCDRGMSPGMERAALKCFKENKPFQKREFGANYPDGTPCPRKPQP